MAFGYNPIWPVKNYIDHNKNKDNRKPHNKNKSQIA